MKFKRVLSLLCVSVLLMALATGCGGGASDQGEGKSDSGKDSTTSTTAQADGGDTNATDNNANGNQNGDAGSTDDTNNNQNGDAGNTNAEPQGIQALTATKVGTLNVSSIYTYDGGVYYRGENGKYGILSLDGKSDTGAIYADCKGRDKYFLVSDKTASDIVAVTDMNSYRLVDGKGKQVISGQYAAFSMVGDDYVLVYAVTELAEGEDDGLVYYNESFTFSPNEDSTWFKGKWSVFDLRTGAMVPGLTGTHKTSVTARGNLLTYVTAAKQYATVNHKGQAISEKANRFDNGFYKLTEGDEYVVYNADGVEQFRGDSEDYEPYSYYSGYILASKYADDGSYYVLMNEKGEIVSAEFAGDSPEPHGNMVLYNEQLCKLDGTVVLAGPFDYVRDDDDFGKALLLDGTDGTVTCVDDLGTVLWTGNEDNVETYSHLLYKEVDGEEMFYSIADQDYTIKGRSYDRWLVKVDAADYCYDLVDTISGKTIISGYENYTTVSVDGCMYIYAKKNGAYDIYLVK